MSAGLAVSAFIGNAPISFALFSSLVLFLPVIATFPPFSISSLDVALPMPRLPPVTRNVESLICMLNP